jgi:hypothetical protein
VDWEHKGADAKEALQWILEAATFRPFLFPTDELFIPSMVARQIKRAWQDSSLLET